MKRIASCALLTLALGACSSAPERPLQPEQQEASRPTKPNSEARPAPSDAESNNARVCRQVMTHDERNYTRGGLYAPGVSDAHPDGELDVSLLQEPTPREEPRSRYGNRSPYTVLGKKYFVLDSSKGYKERGTASWYGTKFHGRSTSSGEIYDMCQFSAAHKTLPVPSYARVTRLDTGQSVIVRVNDRGPFHAGRVIDLSFAAASKLGINRTGTAKVEVEAISDATWQSTARLERSTQSGAAIAPQGDEIILLQVASFSNEDNAKALRKRLNAADIDNVSIEKHRLDGNPVWRVRIGPVKPARLAVVQQKLAQLGLKALRVSAE